MRLKPIRSEIDYDMALKAIERYFNKPPKKGTAEADRFDVLATLIEAYERVRWPIAEADPVDVIRYRMETHGYTQVDLACVLGSRARASEVMRGKRPLSLSMIRRLAGSWEISVEALVGPLDHAVA
jgi:HTH-type transcriptional regulator / antitoxin HigA